jgi:hypothetical protein
MGLNFAVPCADPVKNAKLRSSSLKEKLFN